MLMITHVVAFYLLLRPLVSREAARGLQIHTKQET
jgi:hypothetical protein